MVRSVWLWFLVAALAGCANLVALTPDIIRQDGRMVFSAPKDKVFQAVQDALDAENIGVAIAKAETGLVVSKRFVMAAYALTGRHVVIANQDTIQYDISVKGKDDEVEVVVSPRGFHNDEEVTDREVWQLDGPDGQRHRWQQLFAAIHKMLGA